MLGKRSTPELHPTAFGNNLLEKLVALGPSPELESLQFSMSGHRPKSRTVFIGAWNVIAIYLTQAN